MMYKISNHKWDVKESDSDLQFSEANPFIDAIFVEICEKYEKLDVLSGGSLTEKSKQRFVEVMLILINEKLMEAFSKVKKVKFYWN